MGGQRGPRGCRGRLAVTFREGRGRGPEGLEDSSRCVALEALESRAARLDLRVRTGWTGVEGGQQGLGKPHLGRGGGGGWGWSTPALRPRRLPSRDLCLLTCEMEAGRQGPPSLPPCDSPPSVLPPGSQGQGPQLQQPCPREDPRLPKEAGMLGRPRPGSWQDPSPAVGSRASSLPALAAAEPGSRQELTEPLVLQADAVAWPAWTRRALHLPATCRPPASVPAPG